VAGDGAASQGIAVSGEGSVSVRPDIGVINLGVEVTANTVAEARGQAADAMQAVQDAVTRNQICQIRSQAAFQLESRLAFQAAWLVLPALTGNPPRGGASLNG
jgi:uncharacterized protein YggE